MSDEIGNPDGICPECGKLDPPDRYIDIGLNDYLLDYYCDCEEDNYCE